MADVEQAFAAHDYLGEGPIWSPSEQALYWIDITNGIIHRWSPATGQHESHQLGFNIGCLGLRAKGGLVVATKRGLGVWDAQNGLRLIANPNYDRPLMRFNDGKVDRAGRFFAGTMHEKDTRLETGELYRLDPDASLRVVQAGVRVSNGIGWSLDNKTMYFTDTPLRTIFAYDYDPASGDIANRRPFIVVPEGQGGPDGMTVDSEGCIWSCHWGGWKITRYDPAGQVIGAITLPVERPTACAFGGANLDVLYVTSAALAMTDEQRKQQPWAGDVLRIDPGVKGQVEPSFAG